MIAIRAGTLIDGNGQHPDSRCGDFDRRGTNHAGGPTAQVQIPPDAEVIDASGKTILPGLIDVHVHVHSLGGPDGNFFVAEAGGTQAQTRAAALPIRAARSENGLYDLVQSGVAHVCGRGAARCD